MESNWYSFKDLYGIEGARAAFERACESLFRKLYPDRNVQQVALSQGDGGIDIYVGELGQRPVEVFQCKFFLDKLGTSQKQQIQKSFIKAVTSPDYTMSAWILCLPKVLTREELTWWAKWKGGMEEEFKLAENAIRLYNGNHLINLMKEVKIYNQVFNLEQALLLEDVFHILQRSQSYSDLQSRINEKKASLEHADPAHIEYRNRVKSEIKKLEEDLARFKQQVIGLANSFRTIEINSERLKRAKQHFDDGDFTGAAACLDQDELEDEVKKLKEQQTALETEKGHITEKLKQLANECMLKAQLAVIDYEEPGFCEKGDNFIQKALSLYKDRSILTDAGNIYAKIEEVNKAIDCFEEALSYPTNTPGDIINLYYNIGTIYIKKDHKKSGEYLEKSISLCEKLTNRHPVILTILANALHNLSILYEETDPLQHAELLKKAMHVRIEAAEKDPVYYSHASYTLNRLVIYYHRIENRELLLETFEESLRCLELFIASEPAEAIPFFQDNCLAGFVFSLHYLKYLGLDDKAQTYKERIKALLGPFEKTTRKFHSESAFEIAAAYDAFIRFFDDEDLLTEDRKQMYARMVYYYKESVKYRMPDDMLYTGLFLSTCLLSFCLAKDKTLAEGLDMAYESREYFDRISEPIEQHERWRSNLQKFLDENDTCDCENCRNRRNIYTNSNSMQL